MSPNLLSECIEPVFLNANLDIGGTNNAAAFPASSGAAAAQNWVSLTNHHKVCFILGLGVPGQISTWTASDDIATVTIQQASDSSGTGIKTVRTHTITAGDLDAQGDIAMFEVSGEELDMANSFNHVRALVAATDNGAFTNINLIAIKYQPKYSKVSRDTIEYIGTTKNSG